MATNIQLELTLKEAQKEIQTLRVEVNALKSASAAELPPEQLNQLSAELIAVKQEFSEFRQAVENTFSAASGLGLGIEFSRQLSLLKKPETTEVAPPLPSTGPTVEDFAAVRTAITKMIAEARATSPLSLDQALKIAKGDVVIPPPQSMPVVEETKTLNEVLSLDEVAKLELTF